MKVRCIINDFIKITFVTYISLESCKNSINMIPPLSFKPLSGKVYNYKITEEKTIHQNFGSGNMHSSIIKNILLTYESMKFPIKDYNVLVHINSYNVENFNKITPNFSFSSNFDKSENKTLGLTGDSSSHEKFTDIFSGTNFKLNIDNSGNIIKFDGYSKIRTKIENQSNQANLEKVYNETFFKSLFEKSLIVFPHRFNRMSWSCMDSIDLLQDPIRFKNTFKIVKIDDSIVHIKTFGRIDHDIVIPGNLKIRMIGEKKGTIQVEKSSGMLLKKKTIVSIEGALKTNNKIFTQKLEITTTVESTPTGADMHQR